MSVTAKIVGYDGRRLVIEPSFGIERELLRKNVDSVEILLCDGRRISDEQRKKIFATVRDLSLWSGHEPEFLRAYLTFWFCEDFGCEHFSLSNVDMTTAREFINWLIEFCFYYRVPTRDTLLNRTDDVYRYLYLCLAHRKCAICNDHADVHHVDRIGMGRDREKIVHEGLNAIALCRKHHNAAHLGERELFEKYHIHGIKLDKYLCERLSLRAGKDDENGRNRSSDDAESADY